MIKMEYYKFEGIINKLNIVVHNKLPLIINIDGNKISFLAEDKNAGLYIEETIDNENTNKTIKINGKQLLEAASAFKNEKELYVTEICLDINNDILTVSGVKHSDDLDVEIMDYRVRQQITMEIIGEELDSYDNPMKKEIHGADEWSADELKSLTSLKCEGNVYIAGSKHKCFTADSGKIEEIQVNEFIGHNIIVGKNSINKIRKMLKHNNFDKYYVNFKNKCEIHLQNWDGTFRFRVKSSSVNMEELEFYALMTSLEYTDVLITVIKSNFEDQLKQLILEKGIESMGANIINGERPFIVIGENKLDVYTIHGINDYTLDINIKDVYNAITLMKSDFIGIDICKIDENTSTLRISEINLEKYEDTYEDAIDNIGQLAMRDSLNVGEHRDIREDYLNKKIYLI